MKFLFGFLLFSAVYFLFSSSAFAWGPITHIDFAREALRSVAAYGPAVKTLLERFPYDFLYGALAADMTLRKDYVAYLYNCHNWRVGFLILNEARGDAQKASAFGYLSHLAVDIVAHNYFVPFKIIRSYPTTLLGHVYWEMRFDAKRPRPVWNLAKKVSTMRFPHDDRLFERMIRRTVFSFKTSKRIFRSVLTLHRLSAWRSTMERVHEISRFKLQERDMEEYRRLALEAMTAFLKDPEKAPCTKVDPTGADKILYAKEMRNELKRLSRKGLIREEQARDFLKKVKSALRGSIYHAAELPTASDLLD